MLRRTITMVALSLWIGGVTFYGLVVVPAGRDVLGSAAAQGFVTQVVTVRLNVIGLVALAALAWNAWCSRRRSLWLTWAVMLAAQVVLFLLHPRLDALLDADAHRVLDHDSFYAWHRAYLLVTAAQWLAALAHAVLAFNAPAARRHQTAGTEPPRR